MGHLLYVVCPTVTFLPACGGHGLRLEHGRPALHLKVLPRAPCSCASSNSLHPPPAAVVLVTFKTLRILGRSSLPSVPSCLRELCVRLIWRVHNYAACSSLSLKTVRRTVFLTLAFKSLRILSRPSLPSVPSCLRELCVLFMRRVHSYNAQLLSP